MLVRGLFVSIDTVFGKTSIAVYNYTYGMKQIHTDVLVIGGGAAGMMAAGKAAQSGKKVILLEQNARLGEKLRISGGGRCNITNAEMGEKKLLAHYGAAEPFLYSAFSQFGVKDTFSFFEERGLPLVIQANNRAFPKTEKAADVVRVLEEYMKEGGVSVRKKVRVEYMEGVEDAVTGVVASGERYIADTYILSTGGFSHPETGSTGDGFPWLLKLGHSVKKPTPTIVPLRVQEEWVKRLSGKSLGTAKITLYVNEAKKIAKTGPILCTHFGISGPTILNLAGAVADFLQEGVVTAKIDLHPGMDIGALDAHVVAVFAENKNKALRNVVKEFVPPGTASVILSLLPTVDPEIKVHSLLKEDRRMLVHLLKALPITIEGLMGFDRAVVADGGVALSEIDTRTMRSKRISNLFIIGDLLHITRPSGGYSLQLCWTTGFVAGKHA